MTQKVVILGGGVAGMSAAHELIERNFTVDVYELKGIPGGKARSLPASIDNPPGHKPLPGEHGFRFFPRFYKHITHTMRCIPLPDGRTVFDNLVDTTRIGIRLYEEEGFNVPSRFPRSLADLIVIFKDVFDLEKTGLTESDIEFFAERIWQIITSSHKRRLTQYERLNWWDFIDASNRSPAYRRFLAIGLTRSLVASKPEFASTRTIGDILVQLLFDIAEPGESSDRVLNGPTNQAWIDPWLAYLQKKGVNYQFDSVISAINLDKPDKSGTYRIKSATIIQAGQEREVTGDYYIAALPVERMADLVIQFPQDMLENDPNFSGILKLSKNVAWMNGMQLYLKEDVPIDHGHTIYLDSPWALTSISQKQFWPDVDLKNYGDGSVQGVLSIDISDWGIYINPKTHEVEITSNAHNKASLGRFNHKHAFECSPLEIEQEVIKEMMGALNLPDKPPVLTEDNIHSWFLDPDIVSAQFTLWLIEQESVTRAEAEAYLKKDPRVVLDILNGLVTRGVLKEELDGDTVHYQMLNAGLIRWLMQQVQVTVAQLAAHLNITETQAQEMLNTLARQGFVKKRIVGREVVYESRRKFVYDRNLEPLLINLINSWELRPDAFTAVPNLFLASDYIRTNTDLATMEGANEAARRAVNCIISASGVQEPFCKIYDLHEPDIFALWRWYDYRRMEKGLPWHPEFPGWLQFLQTIFISLRKVKIFGRPLFN